MNELALFNNFFNDALYGVMPDWSFGRATGVPKVDVKEGKDAYTMEMDLPGMSEKDVNVELDHGVLTVSSQHEEKREEKSDKSEDGKWLIRERRATSFSRRFTLPEDVDGEKVEANFKNGVLTVRIPRKALASPKKIAITAN